MKARNSVFIIRVWAKNDNVNIVHYHLYPRSGACSVLNGKINKAKEKFKASIIVSSRNGFYKIETSWRVHTSKPREMIIGGIIKMNAQGMLSRMGIL